VTGRALATMDRWLDASPGGSVATVYSAAYSAACAVHHSLLTWKKPAMVCSVVHLC
jgi:hypothetical protein